MLRLKAKCSGALLTHLDPGCRKPPSRSQHRTPDAPQCEREPWQGGGWRMRDSFIFSTMRILIFFEVCWHFFLAPIERHFGEGLRREYSQSLHFQCWSIIGNGSPCFYRAGAGPGFGHARGDTGLECGMCRQALFDHSAGSLLRRDLVHTQYGRCIQESRACEIGS